MRAWARRACFAWSARASTFFLWVGLAPSGWNFSRMAAVRVCQGVFHARSSDWTMAVTLPRSVSGLRWSPSMERGGEEPHRCRRSAETLRRRVVVVVHQGAAGMAEVGCQQPACVARGGPESGDGVGAHGESELELPKVGGGEDVVGVGVADFDLGEPGGERPPNVGFFVKGAGEGSAAQLVSFQGGGEPGVFVGEPSGVGFVVVEVLGEFEPREARERVGDVTSGAGPGLFPGELGLVGRVLAEGSTERERLTEGGEDG